MRDVRSWLAGLGLETYADVFARNAVDRDVLPDLTDADLEKLGIPLGHRKKLLKAIEALRAEPNVPEIPDDEITLAFRQSGVTTPSAPAERRQLTVMFVDLVGSTELALKLDPEELRELLGAYQDALGAEVGRYGGHVAKTMGDGVLVYFGYPQAHEDDAVRAIYAGLAVTRAVKRLGKRDLAAHGGRLRARVGIATGLVVVGDLVGAESSEAGAVTGETPNLAFRLQEAAGSGRVAVAERTYALAGNAFTYEAAEDRKLKGFPEPVRLWRVLGPSGAESRFEALHGHWLTPLVGREHELALLIERWAQAKEGEGQVVLVAGEPGIGKSRITEVLRERIMADEHFRLRFHCSPYHTNSALHPVIEHLERAAGFEREETTEAKLAKLEALIGQAGVNVAEAAPLIAALLSIPNGDRYAPLAMSPERQKERTLAVLSDQVAGLAAQRPLLLIVEDAHWIDPTTLESVDLAIARAEAMRILIVVTYRPEFQAKWVGRPNVTQIALNRLSRRQGATMIEGVTGGRTLPAEVMDQVVARTDGVPLFVEELTRMVLESGLLREEGGRYVLDGPLRPLAIPATLHDSLMARLDRLAPAKEVAQTAAAIGRTFSHELHAAVVAMEPGKLAAALDQLVEAGLMFPQGSGPEASYTFKHALVRDAAYQSLLKSQRQRLHARIASVLENRFPAQAYAAPEVVAQHFTEAGIDEQAITWWYRAGRRAVERSANIEAISLLEKGLSTLDRLPESKLLKELELDILIALGSAWTTARGYSAPETELVYRRAMKAAYSSNDKSKILSILYGFWAYVTVSGNRDKGKEVAVQYNEIASTYNDDAFNAAGNVMYATNLMTIGDFLNSMTFWINAQSNFDFERHKEIAFRMAEHPAATSLAMGGWVQWVLGYPETALDWTSKGHTIAFDSDHSGSIALSKFYLAAVLKECGMFKDAVSAADDVLNYTTRFDIPFHRGGGRVIKGLGLVHSGFHSEGLSLSDEGSEEWATFPGTWGTPQIMAIHAQTCLLCGDAHAGLEAVQRGLEHAERYQENWGNSELHRLRGELISRVANDRAGEVQSSFETALHVAREQNAKSYELRAAMSLARLWAERGERSRAHDLLAPIYDWFTEGFDTRDLKEAKALIQVLS